MVYEKQVVISNISKFLSALEVDSVKDISFFSGDQQGICICGRSIVHGVLCVNRANNLTCLVGNTCLRYVKDYCNL